VIAEETAPTRDEFEGISSVWTVLLSRTVFSTG